MADAYEFTAEQQDSQERKQTARQIARCVPKLKGSSRNSQLRVLLKLLDQLPQDAAGLGTATEREALLECLHDRAILHSKQKDVKMYAAACFAQLLRIYAPDTPYEDKQLEPVFDLLLWSIEQVQEYQAPTFELAVGVLQSISQTKCYFIMLDWGREEVVLDWVRALLQCVNAGNSAVAAPHAFEVLVGVLNDDAASEGVLETLLSHLVPPKSQENPQTCQLAQAVLKACEAAVKPTLQKYLTTLILSPISSNSDLHQQCYTLIYQLYTTVPQVLLPVIPHLTSELHSDDAAKRLEACQLLGRLLSLPGNKLVNEYRDVLEALLRRYADGQMNIRLAMLDFTSALVAAAGSEELQQQMLSVAAERLRDYEEKVRLAAVKAVSQAARQLLVGPGSTAATAAAGPAVANNVALLSPVDVLLGSIGSQELTDAAAADLDVAAAVELGSSGPAVPAAAVRDLPFVHDTLKQVLLRLRDTKLTVRKAAATHFLGIYRAVVAAGDATQTSKCSWLAARVLLCCKGDKDLTAHVFETTARDGLLGAKTAPAQAAAAWVRMWLGSSELEREALLMLLTKRAKMQVEALQFLKLRRQLSARQSGGAEPSSRFALDQLCVQLAQQLPQPDKVLESIKQLVAVRDNNAFAAMQTAMAPGASQEAYAKARADALGRVGSRSAAAEAVTQLMLWGRPAAWLPPPVLRALLELVEGDPQGEQAELVSGAYELLVALGKAAPLLHAGLLPELHHLITSPDTDLQQLGVQQFVRCAAQMRKCGIVLASASDTDAATATLVQQQLLPCLQRMCRAQAPAATLDTQADEEEADKLGSLGLVSQEGAAAYVAPKAAKWAVYGLAACQDSSSTRRQLEDLADELAASLDASAPDTAAKLQALSVVGRVLPEALARHVETLLHFVTDDYFHSYLDAAAGATWDMQPASSGGSRRRSLGSSLLSPRSQGTGGGGSAAAGGSQAAAAAGLSLKCAALKAMAAACVPDRDHHDAPVETLRVVVRLSEFLEGLTEPDEELRPDFLSDAPPELCGQLRLAAAVALLRLARRHDSRMSVRTYCSLALMMQDDQEAVRAAFAAKLYRLVRFFQVRPSSHQLSAKYAAMLPLAAADPVKENKDKAARMLRQWVLDRRAAVQAQMQAAARGTAEGGSTLQEQPEMLLPYGLYILAQHPDFPQGECADDPESYTPFQYMLQFLLQPLLVASDSTPAGTMAPVHLKICKTIKRTADAGETPATTQLYCLCDMAACTVQALAEAMKLQLPGLEAYAGSIVLPRGLYRALDKADRVSDVSYLPPGFEFIQDPDPAAALAAPGPTAGAGKGTRSKAAAHTGAGGGGGRGRGSKRKAAGQQQQQQEEEEAHAAPQPKRPCAAPGGGKGRSKGRGKAAAAADSDDGWATSSDNDDDAPPSAQKADQLTRRQQVLRQQQQLRQHATAAFTDGGAGDADGDDASQGGSAEEGAAHTGDDAAAAGGGGGDDDNDMDVGNTHQQQQQQTVQNKHQKAVANSKHAAKQQQSGGQRQQQQQQQRQLRQQQLTFAAAAVADASSPAPVRRSRQHNHHAQQDSPQHHTHGGHSGGGGEGGDGGEGSSGESPGPPANGGVSTHHRQQQQQAAVAGRGGRRAGQQQQQQQQQEDEAPGNNRQRGRQQQQQRQPAGQRGTTRQGARAAAAGQAGGDAEEEGDVAMDDDQEQQVQQPVAPTRGKKAAAGRAAAAQAGTGGGASRATTRATRQRGA